MPEVHAVDAGDQRRHEHDRGPGAELLHHLVQPVRRLRHANFQQGGEQVAHVVGELDHPDHVVHHVAVVGISGGGRQGGIFLDQIDAVTKRHRGASQHDRVALQPEQTLLHIVCRRRPFATLEHHVLELVGLVLQQPRSWTGSRRPPHRAARTGRTLPRGDPRGVPTGRSPRRSDTRATSAGSPRIPRPAMTWISCSSKDDRPARPAP